MSRPGLIIGLGGTGQWVATFVKKELTEINNEVMPDNVRILAFDTLPQATAETARAGGDKEVKLGKVKLEKDIEFIHIGDDVFPMAERAEEELPHIRSWFQSNYFIQTLPRAAFNLSAGAGAIRPLGRMGVFYDLSAPARSRLWSTLTSAIQSVKNKVNDKQQLEIIIVSSLAGGTGSGMFLDVANLVRSAASEAVTSNFIIRGMFVLPRAFSMTDRLMRARAFAAWRELDRFMVNDPEMGKKTIDYTNDSSDFNLNWKQRIFDACYLLDPNRGGKNQLTGMAPEEGIFPCVADIISAILDTTAGEMYTQWVTTNLAPIYANNKDKSMHSSLGAYTIQVPMYYLLQEATHELSLNFLEEWLQPERQGNRIVGLAPNRNPTATGGIGKSGADAAYDFLAQPAVTRQGDETISQTQLPRKIFEVLNQDANRTPAAQGAMVAAYADVSLGAKGKSTNSQWLLPFTTLGSDPQSKDIQRRIEEAVNVMLEQKVPPPRALKDEKPAQTINRVIPQVETFKKEYIGTQTASGDFIGGKFSSALDECRDEHLRRFRQTLRLTILNILMPENREGQVSGPGTLGYAVDFARGLVDYLNRFLAFMTAVDEERTKRQPQNRQEMTAQQRQQTARQNVHKRRFFGLITDPKAYDNIQTYMNAEQQLINLQREHLLHDTVEETVEGMRDYALKVLQELNAWVTQLMTGDSSANIRSLQQTLAESQAAIKASREADNRVQKVRLNVSDESIEDSSQRQRQVNEMFSRIVWDINAAPDSFTANLSIAPKRDTSGAITAPGQQFANTSTRIRNASSLNLNSIRSLAESYFNTFKRERMVAPVLISQHNGAELADMLNGNAEPLYQPRGRGPRQTSCYVRVHSNVGDATVEEQFAITGKRLQELSNTQGLVVRMIESDDPYKATMVRSDDCIESRHFVSWNECRDAYISAITDEREPVDPRILHIFPAEVTASHYESKLQPLLDTPHRTFSPRVVMMLEDPKKTRTFFMAYLLGYIYETEEDGQYFYVLQTPDMEDPLRLTKPGSESTDIFVLMNSFVNRGRDTRTNKTGRVQYERVAKTVDQALAAKGGPQERIDWLKKQVNGELYDKLMDEAGAVEGRDSEYANPEYWDLADLLRLMIQEQIESLKERLPRPVRP